MTGSNKPSRSLFADDSSAYWVEDRGLSPSGDNLVTFDRMFAQIPQDNEQGGGLYSFTFPQASASSFTAAHNQLGTPTWNGSDWVVDIQIADIYALELSVGNELALERPMLYQPYGSTANVTDNVSQWVITNKGAPGSGGGTTTRFTVKLIGGSGVRNIYSWNLATRNFSRANTVGRTSTTTLNSESILTYRYVKTDDISTVGLADKFQIYAYSSNNFSFTDAVGTLTLPTQNLYRGMASSRTYVQAEPETPIRWMGNIWQIVGRRIKVR